MRSKTILRSTHLVKQLLFSMMPSILTFELDLILESCGPSWVFLGLGKGLTTVLGSNYVIGQLSFSMFFSIPNFDFDLILGLFLTFSLALMGNFLGWGMVRQLFWGLLI